MRANSSSSSKCLHLIANTKSGSGLGSTVAELARKVCDESGIACAVYDEGDIDDRVRNAISKAKPDDVIVAAGGDGTVRAVADQISKTQIAFGVVPCGTFNFFARAHKIPDDQEAAMRLAATGVAKPVRLGEFNEHIFLINASLGLYAKSIEAREEATAKFGRKRLVVIYAMLKTLLSRHRLLTIRLKTEDALETRRTPMVFIGNNALQLRNLNLSVAKCFKEDKLAVVTMKPVRGWELVRMIWRGITKTLEKEERVVQSSHDALEIETKRGLYKVALDGESFMMRPPFKIRSNPEAIRLVVPPNTEA